MSRCVLVCGASQAQRRRLVDVLDAAFDLDLIEAADVRTALAALPGRRIDLAVVLEDAGDAPGSDLVAFLRAHAIHGRVPVVYLGSGQAPGDATHVLAPGSGDEAVRAAVRKAIGIP